MRILLVVGPTILSGSILCLLFLAGCAGQTSAPVMPLAQPEITSEVIAALNAIEDHGLADWADYGRSVQHRIVYNQLDGFQGYSDLGAQIIYLGDSWLALSADDRGLVLLHELWHLRTMIASHPPELQELLAQYSRGIH